MSQYNCLLPQAQQAFQVLQPSHVQPLHSGHTAHGKYQLMVGPIKMPSTAFYQWLRKVDSAGV